ncbi:hypothetical protein CSW60_21805 [Caulobacter sp. X]|nr:hypothetical protein CSW60_21805 [Caulobacter sp. X]
MGKNPAYLHTHLWTVAGMIDAQERVIWSCRACKAWGHVDLLEIQRQKGPTYCLVDRTAPCRVEGCGGRVGFHYGSPARPLRALRERQAAAQAQQEREEMARAKAAYNAVARRLKYPPLP